MNTNTVNTGMATNDTTGMHVVRQNEVGTDLYTGVHPGLPVAAVRDRTHWGPVWAGLLTALATFLVVELFLYWVGALTVTRAPDGMITGGPSNGWISAIIGIAAFFLGGWVTARSARLRSQGAGAYNGLLVWSLGVVLILAYSAIQGGLAFGAASDAFARLMIHNTGSVNTMIGLSRDAAGWGCLFLVLSAIAAAIGGFFGERVVMSRPGTPTS